MYQLPHFLYSQGALEKQTGTGRYLRRIPLPHATAFEEGQPYTEATVLKGAMDMWAVVAIGFGVNFLISLEACRLCGDRVPWLRLLAGAAVGGLYSGLCLIPGLRFLSNPLWYGVSLVSTVLICWGIRRSTFRRGAVFAVLRLALEGIAQGIGNGGAVSLLLAAAGLGVLCILGFRGNALTGKYVPVDISRGDTRLHLTALRDTGNTLRDPVTGEAVLVIGAQAAQALTGLSREQLRSPVDSVGAIPGLRLVPYRTVGEKGGLMLALKFPDVKIGRWRGSSLVAFAPEGLGDDGYDALTGGAV